MPVRCTYYSWVGFGKLFSFRNFEDKLRNSFISWFNTKYHLQHAISHFTPPTLIHSQTILLALLAQIKIVIVMMEKQLVFSEYFIFKTLTLKKYIGGVGS